MAVTKRKLEGDPDHLDQFVSSANGVIHFKFVLQKKDIEDEKSSFPPEYTHQFFGDSENIFGYIGLKIDLFYSACLLKPFFRLTCREKVKSSKTGGMEADDVYKIISEKQELEPQTDLDSFTESLSEESDFKPFGEFLGSFTSETRQDTEKFQIYRADSTTPGFRDYHNRMQTLILWFIDAASYIDDEDEKWDYFIVHQVIKKGGVTYYPFIGYTTVYRYYAYPQKIRPRISQMFVLPNYQKRGLGTKMLEFIQKCYIKDSEVLDITVEDPSPEFVRIRDFNDSRHCLTLPSFSKEHLVQGFSPDMAKEAQETFKINRKQARRVYEILRLRITDLNDLDDYREYRLDVKNRLNIPFQREKLDMEKLQKSLPAEELKAAANQIPREQRIEQLDHMYQELEELYRHTIERLMLECPDQGLVKNKGKNVTAPKTKV